MSDSTEICASKRSSTSSLPEEVDGCRKGLRFGCLMFLVFAVPFAIERTIYYYDPPKVKRLIAAIAQDDIEGVREALEEGADPNRVTRDVWYYFGFPRTDEWSPMHAAAASPDPQLLALLLDAGGDLGLKARGRRAPLEIAVGYGQFETALAFLEAMESFPGATEIVE
ncbi:MAG: hypothetical protein AAF368_11475, partial [Planctomycetota bacterium]